MFKKLSSLRKVLSLKKILLGVIFLIALILGCLLGIFWCQSLFSFLEISINFSWLSRVLEITPNPTFLSDVAAFEAAIIAFLVPLSIDIISKISERYNSDVITRSFNSMPENKILPPFLLVNIVLAIILRFSVQEDIDTLAWKIIAWLVLAIFIGVALTIWRVINQIKIFISDTKFVINQLYKDVEKSIQ